MYSHSTCDCYCKTQVPIAQQRKEVESDREHVKPLSKCIASKPEVVSSAKKIPLTLAKLVDDEQLDSKRSSVTPPPFSPTLSPETTAIIEDTEKLIKDAEIQMKEINVIGNRGRMQPSIRTRPDEPSLSDECDELLYIRELVTYKFHEANGWIDVNRADSRTAPNQGWLDDWMKPKRGVDLSESRFRTSEERYQEFMRQRRLRAQKLGSSLPIVDYSSKGVHEETRISSDNRLFNGESTKNTKIGECSVQTGPSVDIKRELIAQTLDHVQISPDTSFVHKSSNVATYEISHDLRRESRSSTCIEKFVRIPKESEDTAPNRRSSIELDETKTNDVSERASLEAPNVSSADNETFGPKVDTVRNDVEPNVNDVAGNDEKSTVIEGSRITGRVCQDEQDTSDPTIKPLDEARNDHKQVRFDERIFHENPEKRVDRSLESASSKNATNDQHHVPLSCNETETRRLTNKRGHREVYDERRRHKERQERDKVIDQRFAAILKKYYGREANYTNSNDVVPSSKNTSEDSDRSSDLENLYEPCIDRLDVLLTAYDKTIDNVVRSTNTIDKFLAEIEPYTESGESLVSTPRRGHGQPAATRIGHRCPMRRRTEAKAREAASKTRLSSLNKNASKDRQRRATRTASIKSYLLKNGDDDARRRSLVVSKRSTRFPARTNSSPNERSVHVSKKFQGKRETVKLRERRTVDAERARLAEKLSTKSYAFETDSWSFASSIGGFSSSSARSRDVNEKSTSPPVSANDHAALGGQSIEENVEKSRSTDSKDAPATTGNVESSIVRVLREETRAIEEKIKNMLNVNEIVPMLTKGLLENLRIGAANVEPMIGGSSSRNEPTGENCRSIVSEKENSKNEANVSVTETSRNVVAAPSTDDSRIRSKRDDSTIEETRKIDSRSSQETFDPKAREATVRNGVDDVLVTANDTKVDGGTATDFIENCELFSRRENDNDTAGSAKGPKRFSDIVSGDVGKASATTDNKTTEDASQNNPEILNRSTISQAPEGACNLVKSVTGSAKLSVREHDDLHRVSSSDSLRDCVSLKSSIVAESSRKMDKLDPLSEVNRGTIDEHANETRNAINVCLDRTLNKDQILSELYDDVNKKLFCSTFDTNYSSVLNQNWRLTNSVSAIESRAGSSSSSSRSEGELHMPSSGSYSAGEIRISTKNRSDGENTDDDITVFLTEKMLTSWSESSKEILKKHCRKMPTTAIALVLVECEEDQVEP